jgi:hypothetical protein
VGAQGDWRLHDKASQRAWREVAGSGCRLPAGRDGATAAEGPPA